MLIIALELKGYKRLLLNNIQYFKLSPQNKLQLILGQNGSGKSSVLKELTPLPANHTEFVKDGFKVIEIRHNNSHYLLKSMFNSSGNKFHFIKDDIELNPGGTTSVYKELVKMEFNITPDIHELLIGSNTFHNMSVSERRNWFTRISDSDYTFAIQYYQKLKEQLRDIQGAIKLNQSRLVQESEKLLTETEETKYRTEIAELNKLIALLLESKTPIASNKSDIKLQLNNYETQLTELSAKLISYKKSFLNLENFESVNDIDLAIIAHQSQASSLAMTVDELCKRIDKEQQTFEALQKANLSSFSDIDGAIDNLSLQVASLNKELRTDISFNDPSQSLQALTTIYDSLIDVFSNISENSDRRYSRDNYTRALEEQKSIASMIAQLDIQQRQLIMKKTDLEHIKTHNQIECPKCTHVWSKGYDERIYQQVIADIDSVANKLNLAKEQQVQKDNLVCQFEEYLGLQRQYVTIIKSWTILDPLWSYISTSNLILDNPRQVCQLLESLKVDLQIAIRINATNHSLEENIKLKELISKNQETDLEKLSIIIAELNDQLHIHTSSIKNHKAYVTKLNSYRDIALQMSNYEAKLESILKERSSKGQELINILKGDALNEIINAVRLELTKKEQVISKINIQKALVENIGAQIKDLTVKADVLKIAVKELSPTEGLIAKGLTGFINHFVYQMNMFIKSVWLYPLELVPVAISGDDSLDLDYKFSVKINDGVVVPDVSKTSSAMREIIDIAFRIISLQYLGLQESPIYFDEMGISFDKNHRTAIIGFIQGLINSSNFTQVFMISHYEDVYGSFKNTDITVLCSNNVPLAKDSAFNTNVIIK